jgi:hypothetical protein
MLDVHAPIEPGIGLGGIPIGCPVADLLAAAEPLRVIELPDDGSGADPVTIHSFDAIRTWSVRGIVEQVGAFEGYAGHTADGIGIETTPWAKDDPDPAAQVIQLFVHAAEE